MSAFHTPRIALPPLARVVVPPGRFCRRRSVAAHKRVVSARNGNVGMVAPSVAVREAAGGGRTGWYPVSSECGIASPSTIIFHTSPRATFESDIVRAAWYARCQCYAATDTLVSRTKRCFTFSGRHYRIWSHRIAVGRRLSVRLPYFRYSPAEQRAD